jgi:hypothetical protein
MNSKGLLIVIAVIALGILGMLIAEANRPKTTGEKIGDAVNAVGNDIGNAIEDAGEEIQRSAP